MKKLALFLLLILSCGSSFAVSFNQIKNALRVAGVSGTTLIGGACLYADRESKPMFGKQVSEDRKRNIMHTLQSLHDRGLLNFHPNDVIVEAWNGPFGAAGLFRPRLFVNKETSPTESVLLHEALHISERHPVQMFGSTYLAICGSLASRRPIRSLLVFPLLTRFVLGKIYECRADTFAAENCSSAFDFKMHILLCDLFERRNINALKEKLPSGLPCNDSVAKFANFLLDEHVPLVGYRADRLQKIYDRRIKEGSLKVDYL